MRVLAKIVSSDIQSGVSVGVVVCAIWTESSERSDMHYISDSSTPGSYTPSHKRKPYFSKTFLMYKSLLSEIKNKAPCQAKILY